MGPEHGQMTCASGASECGPAGNSGAWHASLGAPDSSSHLSLPPRVLPHETHPPHLDSGSVFELLKVLVFATLQPHLCKKEAILFGGEGPFFLRSGFKRGLHC